MGAVKEALNEASKERLSNIFGSEKEALDEASKETFSNTFGSVKGELDGAFKETLDEELKEVLLHNFLGSVKGSVGRT